MKPDEANPKCAGTASNQLSRIFLTHADIDVDLARLLHDEILRARPELNVFVSSLPGAIPTGEEWLGEIERQLKAADAYLVLITPASVQRLWVWFECGAAFMSNKKMIGICAPDMKKSEVPSPLSGHQLLSLDSAADCAQMFRELGARVGSAEAFAESARAAAQKRAMLLLEASGWVGVLHQGRYFAWDGPLDSLADWNKAEYPAGLENTIRLAGHKPGFGDPDRSEGWRPVFQTNRQSGKRPVVDSSGKSLLVRVLNEAEKSQAEFDRRLWAEWTYLLDEIDRLTKSTEFSFARPMVEQPQDLGLWPQDWSRLSVEAALRYSNDFSFHMHLHIESGRSIAVGINFHDYPSDSGLTVELSLSPCGERQWRRVSDWRSAYGKHALGKEYEIWRKTEAEVSSFESIESSGLAAWCIQILRQYKQEQVRREQRRLYIQQLRLNEAQCTECGNPLGVFDHLLSRRQHNRCVSLQIIQAEPFRAHPFPLRSFYVGMLTAKTDGVVLYSEVNSLHRLFSVGLFSGGRSSSRRKVGELKRGQQISGHVTPAYEFDPPSKRETTYVETANIFVVFQAKGDTLPKLQLDTDVIVRADLVDLSYCLRFPSILG